ncbi:hypothetical protein D3C76_1514130 [compost metagenome]
MLARNGWEHYDLEKEMGGANIALLLELFKRENKKYIDKCIELVAGNLTEDERNKIIDHCTLLDEARVKVSLRIAEILTTN